MIDLVLTCVAAHKSKGIRGCQVPSRASCGSFSEAGSCFFLLWKFSRGLIQRTPLMYSLLLSGLVFSCNGGDSVCVWRIRGCGHVRGCVRRHVLVACLIVVVPCPTVPSCMYAGICMPVQVGTCVTSFACVHESALTRTTAVGPLSRILYSLFSESLVPSPQSLKVSCEPPLLPLLHSSMHSFLHLSSLPLIGGSC